MKTDGGRAEQSERMFERSVFIRQSNGEEVHFTLCSFLPLQAKTLALRVSISREIAHPSGRKRHVNN